MNAVVSECGLDLVQLHGQEDVRFLEQVSVPCIKVIHIPTDVGSADQQVEAISSDIQKFENKAIAILFDSKVPSGQAGGSGASFDWNILDKCSSLQKGEVKVLLAGGLTPENVQEAVLLPYVAGVDVSSGIETDTPRRKDTAKLRSFLTNALSNSKR